MRERREDIPLLVEYFIAQQCEANHLEPITCTPDAYDFLSRLPYPGNIRELKNLVDRTILISGKRVLEASDFENQYETPITGNNSLSVDGMTLDEIERQTILNAIDKCNGNMQQTARTLGISRQALYRRLEKYNIKYED